MECFSQILLIVSNRIISFQLLENLSQVNLEHEQIGRLVGLLQ